MGVATITELLLDLAFAPEIPDAATLRAVPDADWAMLGRCAQQHRLEPMLHDRLAGDPSVPERLRCEWRDSYRFWAIKAAAARVDLTKTIALLDAHGLSPLALKGAFLAWHAYPAPALRPLRDLDILVPADRVNEAYALLSAHGYTALSAASSEVSHHGKHLPPLVARCGTTIELHHRLWEQEGELDHHSPRSDDEAVRARAVTVDGITFPCAEDMLTHLIVHAVYSHRLDCGPLLLSDIGWLAGARPVDWGELRARASCERWEPGLDLTIALLHRYCGRHGLAGGTSADAAQASAIPGALIDAAADLMLQDLDTRRSAGVAATALVRGFGGLAARVGRGARARLRAVERHEDVQGIGTWTGTRLRRTVGELIDPAARNQARDLSRLSKWLGA